MKTLSVLFVLLISYSITSLAIADEGDLLVDVNGISYHANDYYYSRTAVDTNYRVKYNEKNYGLGLSYRLTPTTLFKVGYFKNSFYVTSKYVGLSFHTKYRYGVAFGFGVGLVSGYGNKMQGVGEGAILPIIYPTISVGSTDMNIVFGVIPDPEQLILTANLQFKIF